MKAPLVIIAAVISCHAQAPAFEVASVKVNRSGNQGGRVRPEPARLDITNMTLRSIVRYAYNVKDLQISGGPAWFSSDCWDIAATAGKQVSDDELKKMLQSLLTERFQMSIRGETKDLPVYALLVAKNGPKLAPDTAGQPERFSLRVNGSGLHHLEGENLTLSGLAAALLGPLGRMVIDRTRIEGKFDFKLDWMPDAANMPSLNGAKIEQTGDGPSIFTAVQEQLGLKLESTKGPVEILVIERAEKAAEN